MTGFFLYALEDPRTDQIRYIGYTSDPEVRHRKHMQRSKLAPVCHRTAWLKELQRAGLWPIMVILGRRSDRVAIQQAEREAIARFRQEGCELVNGTPGGDGGPTMLGRKRSAEAIRKTAESNRGRTVSAEQRAHHSAVMRGKKRGARWELVDGKRVWFDDAPNAMSKWCSCCRTWKARDIAIFGRSSYSADGLGFTCKACVHSANTTQEGRDKSLAAYARTRGQAYTGRLREKLGLSPTPESLQSDGSYASG